MPPIHMHARFGPAIMCHFQINLVAAYRSREQKDRALKFNMADPIDQVDHWHPLKQMI